jgi:hypothetical protein
MEQNIPKLAKEVVRKGREMQKSSDVSQRALRYIS